LYLGVLEDLAIIIGFRDGSSNDEARTKKNKRGHQQFNIISKYNERVVPKLLQVQVFSGTPEAYMIVNFRIREISRDARKFSRILTLKNKKNTMKRCKL
jgi:hypothetical protein